MIKTPTKFIALLSGAAFLMSSAFAQGVTTDPVGYTTIALPGNGGSGASISFIAIPLLHSAEYTSVVDSVTTGERKINFANATFTPSEFITGGTYRVEITTGASTEGMIATIVANDATSVTVDVSEDITPSLAGGEGLKIRKYRTIGDVFGANNEAGLVAGVSNNFSAADTILLPDGSGGFDSYFYNNHAIALFNGWRQTTGLTIDASGETLPATMGFVVKHQSATPLDVVVSGEVQINSVEVPINAGVNFIASAYPTNTTLADVFGSNNEAGLVAGVSNNFSAADTVLLPNGSGGFDTYFYNNHAIALFNGWRQTTGLTVDAADTVISTGTTALVVKREAAGFDLVQNPNF